MVTLAVRVGLTVHGGVPHGCPRTHGMRRRSEETVEGRFGVPPFTTRVAPQEGGSTLLFTGGLRINPRPKRSSLSTPLPVKMVRGEAPRGDREVPSDPDLHG